VGKAIESRAAPKGEWFGTRTRLLGGWLKDILLRLGSLLLSLAELNGNEEPLFTLLPRSKILGNCERIFMRGCIKVPAPTVRDRCERAHSPGPNV
jgi:hypothetical protein